MKSDTSDLQSLDSSFPTIRLKFGVDRKTDKLDSVPDDFPIVGLDMVESWTGKLIENEEESNSLSTGLVKFTSGDVLFGKLRPYLAKGFVADENGAASPEFLVLKPSKFNSRFLKYVVLSRNFVERVDASTFGARMPRASWEFIGSLEVPCPDLETQQTSAAFLHHHTAQIDALIEKNQRLLELLGERRFATISRYVTHGFTSNEKIPDNRDKWVEEIPVNWDVVKFKLLTEKIGSGVTPDGGSEVYVDDGITFIRSQNVQFEGLDLEDVVYIDETTHAEMQATALKSQDVLLNITGASIGRCALVSSEILPANVNQHVCIIRPSLNQLDPAFLNYVISSYIVQNQIFADQEGASREAITFSQIGDFVIPLPPLSKQTRISSHLDQTIEIINTVYSRVEEQIDLLEQKRQALITAAVTGKIDVSDWEPPAEEAEVSV